MCSLQNNLMGTLWDQKHMKIKKKIASKLSNVFFFYLCISWKALVFPYYLKTCEQIKNNFRSHTCKQKSCAFFSVCLKLVQFVHQWEMKRLTEFLAGANLEISKYWETNAILRHRGNMVPFTSQTPRYSTMESLKWNSRCGVP